jgi:hypothetical protein
MRREQQVAEVAAAAAVIAARRAAAAALFAGAGPVVAAVVVSVVVRFVRGGRVASASITPALASVSRRGHARQRRWLEQLEQLEQRGLRDQQGAQQGPTDLTMAHPGEHALTIAAFKGVVHR